jgi:hypothetical protein
MELLDGGAVRLTLDRLRHGAGVLLSGAFRTM